MHANTSAARSVAAKDGVEKENAGRTVHPLAPRASPSEQGANGRAADAATAVSPPAAPPDKWVRKPEAPPGCCLYVGNIPISWTDEDLSWFFAAFGARGQPPAATVFKVLSGAGFVMLDNVTVAQNAITAMHGTQVEGRRLKVVVKTPRAEQPSKAAATGALPQDPTKDGSLVATMRAPVRAGAHEGIKAKAEKLVRGHTSDMRGEDWQRRDRKRDEDDDEDGPDKKKRREQMPKLGSVHAGTVRGVQGFGCFVRLDDCLLGKDHLLHKTEITGSISTGCRVWVKVRHIKQAERRVFLTMLNVDQRNSVPVVEKKRGDSEKNARKERERKEEKRSREEAQKEALVQAETEPRGPEEMCIAVAGMPLSAKPLRRVGASHGLSRFPVLW